MNCDTPKLRGANSFAAILFSASEDFKNSSGVSLENNPRKLFSFSRRREIIFARRVVKIIYDLVSDREVKSFLGRENKLRNLFGIWSPRRYGEFRESSVEISPN